MDYSNYEKSSPLYDESRKAKLGYFKDELCGKFACLEFVGLRSKCYAMSLEEIKTEKNVEKKVCKGVGRSAIKNRMRFDQFKETLFKNITRRHEFNSIRSVNHNIKTVVLRKKALNFFDTKRWLFDCGIHSVPYGSFLIEKYQNKCPRCEKSFEMK